MSDEKAEAKKRAETILASHGIEMSVDGCGCCGSPCVTFVYRGETILDGEPWCCIDTGSHSASAPAARDRLAADLAASRAERDRLRGVLRRYEAWEASLILDGDWSGSTPRLTQRQCDELVEIQALRNAALAPPAEGGGE